MAEDEFAQLINEMKQLFAQYYSNKFTKNEYGSFITGYIAYHH